MTAARFRVQIGTFNPRFEFFNWDEVSEVLGFVDCRNVLALEVGKTYTDFEDDIWERVE